MTSANESADQGSPAVIDVTHPCKLAYKRVLPGRYTLSSYLTSPIRLGEAPNRISTTPIRIALQRQHRLTSSESNKQMEWQVRACRCVCL